MSDYAIKVEGVSKDYQIIKSPWDRFLYHVFKKKSGELFSALRDINFTVNKGETFGIIGTNGSGKSTLLQIIAGIIPATRGSINVNGKVSALLELGSGFNPESTGYENIYLNAAILGVNKSNVDDKLAEIIGFADIGKHINEPVKTYSSGMFIRLAFAVAINVEADIIIIDEALAVGDIFFRQKCYSKLNELKSMGKTIILVSHGMNEVEQFCDRALLIDNGKQIMLDKSSEVVAKYYILNQEKNSNNNNIRNDFVDKIVNLNEKGITKCFDDLEFFDEKWKIHDRAFCDLTKSIEHSNGDAEYVNIGIFNKNGFPTRVFKQGEYAYFYTEIKINNTINVPINGVVLINQKNIIIHGKNTFQTECVLPYNLKKGNVWYSCIKLKLDIEEGEYTFETGFSSLPKEIYDRRADIPHEEINQYLKIILDRRNVAAFLVQGKEQKSSSSLKFYGLVDLDSEFDSYNGG